MGKIKILSDQVISKIAAGEIVERPASVVKELIENSLDASSTSIKVNLISGGKKLISVEDNGTGMSRDDALLSLERHATSKIKDSDDIENITTLGFRGEALPSISSVSRFELTTKSADDLSGVRILIDGGKLIKVDETGCPVGTMIEVKNLFYNTKPRLKFLKKIDTEFSNVLDIVQRHSISSFNVSFQVAHNGRDVMFMYSRDNLLDRLNEIFRNARLYNFESEEDGVRVFGYLTGPDDSRSSTYKIYSYVNNRPVKDRLMIRNIISAYGRILEKGRYPQGVIFVETSPGNVDINVHPTKNEVRFRNPFLISNLIQGSIINMLESGQWLKNLKTSIKNTGVNNAGLYHYGNDKFASIRGFDRKSNEQKISSFKETGVGYVAETDINNITNSDSGNTVKQTDDIFGRKDLFSRLEVVGQVKDSYIVCQSDRGLTLIDQHAAHERINFERFKSQFESNKLEIQKFLIPITFDLSSHETSVLEENYELFKNFGFEIEKFGINSFLLRSAPSLLKNADFGRIIIDVIGEISILDKQESLNSVFQQLIATIACHSSVTANERLDNNKLKYLLAELDKTELPFFCPHGRPVYKEFTFQEIERFFKRT